MFNKRSGANKRRLGGRGLKHHCVNGGAFFVCLPRPTSIAFLLTLAGRLLQKTTDLVRKRQTLRGFLFLGVPFGLLTHKNNRPTAEIMPEFLGTIGQITVWDGLRQNASPPNWIIRKVGILSNNQKEFFA